MLEVAGLATAMGQPRAEYFATGKLLLLQPPVYVRLPRLRPSLSERLLGQGAVFKVRLQQGRRAAAQHSASQQAGTGASLAAAAGCSLPSLPACPGKAPGPARPLTPEPALASAPAALRPPKSKPAPSPGQDSDAATTESCASSDGYSPRKRVPQLHSEAVQGRAERRRGEEEREALVFKGPGAAAAQPLVQQAGRGTIVAGVSSAAVCRSRLGQF
jgi:hypothetical protein